jgi:Zn-dependent alcohol dehydrogenase
MIKNFASQKVTTNRSLHICHRRRKKKTVAIRRESYLAFGNPDFTEAEIDAVSCVSRGLGSASCVYAWYAPLFANFYLEGKPPLDKLITYRCCLDDTNQALDDLEQNRVVRPLIEMDATLGSVI